MSATTSASFLTGAEELFRDLGQGYKEAGEILYLQSVPLDSLDGCRTVFKGSNAHPQLQLRAKARFLELAPGVIEAAQDKEAVMTVIMQVPQVEGFQRVITSAFAKYISLCDSLEQAKSVIEVTERMIHYYRPGEINVMLANLAASFDDLVYVYALCPDADKHDLDGRIYLKGASHIVLEKAMALFRQTLADEAVSPKDAFSRLASLPTDFHAWLIKALFESARMDEEALRAALDVKPIEHLRNRILEHLDAVVERELKKAQTVQELGAFEGRLYGYRSESAYKKLWRELAYPSVRAAAKTFAEFRSLLNRVDGQDEEECLNALLPLATTFEEVHGMLPSVAHERKGKCIAALVSLSNTHENFVALRELCRGDGEKMKAVREAWLAFIGQDRIRALSACKALDYDQCYDMFLDRYLQLSGTLALAREAFDAVCWQDKGNRALEHLLRHMTTVDDVLDLMGSEAIKADLYYLRGVCSPREPDKIARPLRVVSRGLEIAGNDKEAILRFARGIINPVPDVQAAIIAALAPFYQKDEPAPIG